MGEFLSPLFKRTGSSAQYQALIIYLFGLIAQGEQKSMERIAERFSVPYERIRHFITGSALDRETVRHWLVEVASTMLGGPTASPVIDDTALLKKGKSSVGVARQYAGQVGQVGKVENCQALVPVTLASGGIPCLLGLHLCLPKSWDPRTGSG